MTTTAPEWHPNPGPQTRFLQTAADEALFGGAAGGSKSEALLVEAQRQIANPNYRGILFRRTFPELEQAKGLIDRSKQLYSGPRSRGSYGEQRHRWTFPSGALIDFGHMGRDDDRLKYQGAGFAFIGFDELTHFTERQYLYLFSRNRAADGSGLRCYMRAGTNPGGPGHEWVKRRWGAWLDKKHPNPAKPGELRWYAQVDDVDTEVGRDHPDAKSRTFIPAFVRDNPYLAGTDYERNLKLLPLVERKRLLEGDWDIMAAAGNVFRREWFEIVDAAPKGRGWVSVKRFWDLAATLKETDSDDPDYLTSGKVGLRIDGTYYIFHVSRQRCRWKGVKAAIIQTAQLDGRDVDIGIEQEPGASGKLLIEEIIALPELVGYSVQGFPAHKDKLSRAKPWSAQAEAGNIKIVKSGWDIEGFLDECAMFPDGPHDDRVDVISGAVEMLADRSRLELGYDPRLSEGYRG